MFNQWLDKISAALDPASDKGLDVLDIERVSAMLLVEIARADHQIDQVERASIVSALQQSSNLDDLELEQLVEEACEEADSAVSLYEHVRVVNEHFNKDSKIAMVEQMWRVAIADGNIDQYEEYTIRKLCDLIHVKHRDYMQAKLRVI